MRDPKLCHHYIIYIHPSPLQHCVMRDFSSPQRLIASEVEDNQLLTKVLEVLSLLVKYGYYDDPDDVDAVLRPLTSVLDGMSDIPFPAELSSDSKTHIHTHIHTSIETH